MKKMAKFALASSFTLLLLTACSPASKGEKAEVKKESSGLSVEILEGEFVTPPDKTIRGSKDYIALKVKVKNNTSDSINLFGGDVTLYDDEGDEVDPTHVWDDTETVDLFDTTKLGKGKSSTGYLVYEISKKVSDYEMKFSTYTTKNAEKLEVDLEFNTKEFVDNRKAALSLAKTYVDGVFLNGSSDIRASESTAVSFNKEKTEVVTLGHKAKSKEKKTSEKEASFELDTDLVSDREDFINSFVEGLDGTWTYYKPSLEERTRVALAYVNENAKRSEVDYRIKSYLPGVVTVYVRPNVVDISTIDTYNLVRDYVKSKGDAVFADYEAAQREAEKYVFDKLPEMFSSASLATPEYMPSEGYTLTFVEDDGVWVLARKDRYNYDYENLAEAFSGS